VKPISSERSDPEKRLMPTGTSLFNRLRKYIKWYLFVQCQVFSLLVAVAISHQALMQTISIFL